MSFEEACYIQTLKINICMHRGNNKDSTDNDYNKNNNNKKWKRRRRRKKEVQAKYRRQYRKIEVNASTLQLSMQ